MLLTGMGADEVFSGYRVHLAAKISDSYSYAPRMIRSTIENLISLMPQSNSNLDFKYVRWLKSFVRVASLPRMERGLAINNSALNSKEFLDFLSALMNTKILIIIRNIKCISKCIKNYHI